MYLIVKEKGMQLYNLSVSPDGEKADEAEKPDTGNKTFPVPVGIHECEEVSNLVSAGGIVSWLEAFTKPETLPFVVRDPIVGRYRVEESPTSVSS